jgi:ribosomal protein L11 methyltransferase
VTVPPLRAEEARAVMIELFPEGFEERDGDEGLELAAYTDAGGEERVWQAFGAGASEDVADDWADRWRRFHRPVRVSRVWVGPPWERAPAGIRSVVIDPGRAFGTGAHATTRLCLSFLQRIAPCGLLDVGCGSGVLAIAAAKLGFAPVVAIDLDPQAVAATNANAAANGVAIETRLGDATELRLPETDAAVANLTLTGVEEVGRRLRSRLVIVSGYLVSDVPSIPGFRIVERLSEDGWAADLLAHQE